MCCTKLNSFNFLVELYLYVLTIRCRHCFKKIYIKKNIYPRIRASRAMDNALLNVFNEPVIIRQYEIIYSEHIPRFTSIHMEYYHL